MFDNPEEKEELEKGISYGNGNSICTDKGTVGLIKPAMVQNEIQK